MDATAAQSQRATSLDQLTAANGGPADNVGLGGSPPQQAMQQATAHTNASDNELVQDILQEMQSSNDAAAAQASAAANNAAIARQMDPNINGNVPAPETAADIQAYSAETNAGLELEKQYGQMPSSASMAFGRTAEDTAPKGLFAKFNPIEFVKTVLLFMILYIVFTSGLVQGLMCKIPMLCVAVAEGVVADPKLNFMGTVAVAFMAGLVMATVQAFV